MHLPRQACSFDRGAEIEFGISSPDFSAEWRQVLPTTPPRPDRTYGASLVAGLSATRIGGMFGRLTALLRRRRVAPPEDLDTREELEAREEGRRLLEDKDTYRALGRAGPDMTSGPRRDAGR